MTDADVRAVTWSRRHVQRPVSCYDSFETKITARCPGLWRNWQGDPGIERVSSIQRVLTELRTASLAEIYDIRIGMHHGLHGFWGRPKENLGMVNESNCSRIG